MECNELVPHGTGIGEMICCNDLCVSAASSTWPIVLRSGTAGPPGAGRGPHGLRARIDGLVAPRGGQGREKQGHTATASQLLHEAIPFAEESREVDIARQIDELLRRLSQAEATNRATLRPEGGTWHIQYNGTDVHLPDLKGLWHLRELLARPHQPVAALSLIGASSDEPLPPPTPARCSIARRSRYRQRLAELDDALDAAALRGDRKRQAERTAEREALIEELKRATGLGGRPAGRVQPRRPCANVTRTIRHAIGELASRAPDLAAHLEESIVTGVDLLLRTEGRHRLDHLTG